MLSRFKTTAGLMIATGALLMLPGAAQADTLHATPDGSGTTCSAAAPCQLQTAVVDQSAGGDTVVVHPGSYDLGVEQLVIKAGLTVRGVGPGRRPVITSACCENPAVFPTAVQMGLAGAIRDLEIIHPGRENGGIALDMSPTNGIAPVAERVVAVGASTGCLIFPGSHDFPLPVLADSVCVSTNPNGVAVSGFIFPGDADRAAELSGVTAHALGDGGVGLRWSANGTGTGEVVARVSNSIITGDAVDVRTAEDDELTAAATVEHSNYDTTDSASGGTITAPGTLGNQTEPPLLVDPGSFDFTQRPGSPTIDAGEDLDAVGKFDLEGNPRIVAPAVDIGAHEHRPRCGGKPATIVATPGTATVGTPGRDVIVGTPKADVIRARGGRDVICALGGRDRINAGGGTDQIRAGGGDDRANGGGGKRDKVLGQAKNDVLSGGAGARDLCHGGPGRDRSRSSCERVKGTP